jgi:HK97 family phage major capsid protein
MRIVLAQPGYGPIKHQPQTIIGYGKRGPIRVVAGGSSNPYLDSLREKYNGLKDSIAGIQTRAKEASRDLTPEELRSVTEMSDRSKTIWAEIQTLSEVELRNAQNRKLQADVDAAMAGGSSSGGGGDDNDDDGGTDPHTRAQKLGGATAVDRDPGHYRAAGGGFSFIADNFLSKKMGDEGAAKRLVQHERSATDFYRKTDKMHLRDVLGAGATTAGAGLVPPVWLAEQFAPILHKRLRVATLLRQVPWAGPFAWTIPVANTGANTSSVAEGVNTTETDPTYGTITVTPKAVMGYSEISRQMLEASNPAVDSIVWGDLVGNFYDNVELEVIAAMNGQSGVNTVTVSAGAATTGDILAQRTGLLNAIAAIADNNAGDATFFAGRNSRWITYLLMQDTTGRPLISTQRYGPSNTLGLGNDIGGFRKVIVGELEGLEVATSPTIAASSGFVVNGEEALFSVSPPLQFRFDEPAGPALIRIGVWGYEAVTFGRRPKAVTKITFSGS